MTSPAVPDADSTSVFAPLGIPTFRRIWLASLGSSFGMLIQGVGAAWAMTELSGSPDMVALVQTAAFTPTLLLSLVSGAIADMYDRRIVGLVSIAFSATAAVSLAVVTYLGLLTPMGLLGFGFAIGTGMAMFGPAWQASVSEQVPSRLLPQAVSLNSISYNIARSFGPAIGGALVAATGAIGAFVANAFLYTPMFIVLLTWRRIKEAPRLPPETLGRAMISGVRYLLHSPAIRVVLLRTLLLGMIGGAISAMMPLVARDLVKGGALSFGVLLGAFGMGAVVGALSMARIRERFDNERVVALSMLAMGSSAIAVSFSHALPLSVAALLVNGAAWMVSVASYNIEIQLAVPRWVAGRTLAVFQAAISGGIATAGIVWGVLAREQGVHVALLTSGVAMLVLPLLSLWLRMPRAVSAVEEAREALADPEVALGLTERSGPVIIEIEYEVDPEQARDFYLASLNVQRTRQRNGAYGWSIARDIAEPSLWTERFHCPTWSDYLRQRIRATQAERDLQQAMGAFHMGAGPVRVRRMLERPFGSVRFREDTPDATRDMDAPLPPRDPQQ